MKEYKEIVYRPFTYLDTTSTVSRSGSMLINIGTMGVLGFSLSTTDLNMVVIVNQNNAKILTANQNKARQKLTNQIDGQRHLLEFLGTHVGAVSEAEVDQQPRTAELETGAKCTVVV